MNDIRWNAISLKEFRSLACLTPIEDIVLEAWANEKSEAYMYTQKYMSERTVERARNSIRKKYDDVQPYTPLLPERTKYVR